MNNPEQKPARIVIEYDPARQTISHSLDSRFPPELLLMELQVLSASIVQAQMMMRMKQAQQQQAEGIQIASGNLIPPEFRPRR